jgi:Flp pilus assembly pilin Flp
MSTLRYVLKDFWIDEKGLETVEYAVMVALIVAALVTALGLLGAAVSGRFGTTQALIDAV